MEKFREIYADLGPMMIITLMLAVAFLGSVIYTTFFYVPQ